MVPRLFRPPCGGLECWPTSLLSDGRADQARVPTGPSERVVLCVGMTGFEPAAP